MSGTARPLLLWALVNLLCACSVEPTAIADRREVAAHREFGRPIIRGADACVGEIWRERAVGYGNFVRLTMRVDRDGRVRLVEVNGPPAPFAYLRSPACIAQVEQAIATWRYRPFERDGSTVVAQITDNALLAPAERWRTPRRVFPQIANPDDVVITLERQPGLVVCSSDRSNSYILRIRGDGAVSMTERVHGGVEGGPLLVDGETRHYSVSREAVASLIERFRASDFFSLEDEYPGSVSDAPGQILTFESGAHRARVVEYAGETVGMPLVVRELQVAVDATAGLTPLLCGPDMWL